MTVYLKISACNDVAGEFTPADTSSLEESVFKVLHQKQYKMAAAR